LLPSALTDPHERNSRMRFVAVQLRSRSGVSMDDPGEWQSQALEHSLKPLPRQVALGRPTPQPPTPHPPHLMAPQMVVSEPLPYRIRSTVDCKVGGRYLCSAFLNPPSKMCMVVLTWASSFGIRTAEQAQDHTISLHARTEGFSRLTPCATAPCLRKAHR